MGKYRKKPVVIEARQWGGPKCYADVIEGWLTSDHTVYTNGKLEISTLEGAITADIDDYIIKGIQGEFYPCKPDIFAATYEVVE